MKLIRLYKKFENTLDGNTALFDNNFQTDLVLPPKSKIALQNLAIDTINPTFVVNDDNYDFAWGVVPGLEASGENILTLPVGTITQDNVDEFASSWTDKMNQSTAFDQQLEAYSFGIYYYGMQWKITIDKFTNFTNKISKFCWLTSEYQIGLDEAVDNNVGFNQQGSGPSLAIISTSTVSSFESDTYSTCLIAKKVQQLSQGCGSVRCQLNTLNQSGTEVDPNKNGFIMGLTELEIDDNTNPATALSPGDGSLKYGIRATNVGSGIVYYVYIDGTRYGPVQNITPQYSSTDGDNDMLEIIVNGDEVVFNIWQLDSASNEVERRDLLADPGVAQPKPTYTANTNLCPLVIFSAGNDSVSVRNLIYTPNPFLVDTSVQPVIAQSFADPEDAPPVQSEGRAENKFLFDSTPLANYLGFDGPAVGPESTQPGIEERGITVLGDTNFNPLYFNDAFMVELKDLYLESYDAYKEQRKNILMFMSIDDSTGQMNWRANEPIFIDLNNKEPMILRNIRAEVLYADYQKLRIQSDAFMTLLVKGPNEI